MTITLQLSPETESKLHELASQSGQTLEKYLERLAEEAAARGTGRPAERSAEEWIAEFRAWAASHPSSGPIADDSRESIYAGRGE
jgi:predicted transcriptional regulator